MPRKKKQRLVDTLQPAQWKSIFDKCNKRYFTGLRDLALYTVMYRGGLRIGEALNLRSDSVNVETGEIRVPEEGKSGERIVFLPDWPNITDLMAAWVARRDEKFGKTEYFFVNSEGERMCPASVRKTLALRAKKSGIDCPVTPHMMRHSFATEMLASGEVDIYALKEMLGHSDLATTKIYLHSVPGRAHSLMRSRQVA